MIMISQTIKQSIFISLIIYFTIFINVNAATVRFYDGNLTLIETRNFESEVTINIDNTTIWYLTGSSVPLDNHTVQRDINLYSAPLVKEITSEKELDDVRNSLNSKYMLLSDIDLTNEWRPIGGSENPFTGVFNGNGYKINGLWFDNSSAEFVGLFGHTSGALIRDIEVNTDVKKGGVFAKTRVGALIGDAAHTVIINSRSSGLVRGGRAVGGIAGHTAASEIKNSYSTCDIESYGEAGGIAGLASGHKFQNSIYENVYFSGTIRLKESYAEYGKRGSILEKQGLAGGIVGYSYGIDIINSHFSGSIEGGDESGGIVGNMNYGKILNSYSKGRITGNNHVGGLIGYQGSSTVSDSYSEAEMKGKNNIGGISGSLYNGVIELSYFAGSVKGENSVGGIIGWSVRGSNIINSYSKGLVTGKSAVGGITGQLAVYSFISNSYSSASVSGKENVGGIVGENIRGECSRSERFMGIDVEEILAENNLGEECPYLSGVRNTYFTGSVKGTGKYTGGIVGYNVGLISESYVLGSVEGGEYAGGITGYTKSESFDYNDDDGELKQTTENSLAANTMIKGKTTARIAAFIDGEQKTIPNNFAISASNKSFTRFSEGDYYTGVSKNEKELKDETTYSAAPPEGLGWQFQNDVNQNTEDYPWTMEGSTTGYPIFYWQVKKPECYYCKFQEGDLW